MTEPPPLMNYQARYGVKPPIEHLWGKFFAGLGIGCGVSALAWFLPDYNRPGFENYLLPMAWGLPALKLSAGVTLTCIRRWRPMGIGLLIAIPLGVLIFFVGCATSF